MNNLPKNIREFDDYDSIRNSVYDGVLNAIQTKFPIDDGVHELHVKDVAYTGPKEYSLTDQKDALLSDKKLYRKVHGTVELRDKESGSILDSKRIPLMKVPVFTNRGTIVNKGNEYVMLNQARLKYGVYTRKKTSGEYEAQFNVKPGTGSGFRIWMEPKTGIFRFNMRQANIPVYPIFKALGVSDDSMKKAWGPDIYHANVAKVDARAIDRLAGHVIPKKKLEGLLTTADKANAVRDIMMKNEMDPYVLQNTLGISKSKTLTPEILVRSTNKLLNIARNEENEDDRDDLRYTTIHGPEDLIRERIDKDAGRVTRNMLYKVRRDRNLRRISNYPLDPYMQSLMFNSGLVSPIEETNPYQLLEQSHRITKMGEGGIGAENAITDTARDVRATQAGFVDPIAGPESGRIGIDFRAAYKTFKGKDGNLYAEFKNAKTGKSEYLNPMDTYGKVIGFPGETPDKNGLITVVNNKGKLDTAHVKSVDYWIPSTGHMYSSNINMVPMLTGFQTPRAFYSGKYFSQYIPMEEGEAPLIQTLSENGVDTYPELYGKAVGTIAAKESGTVTKVTDKYITITDSKGEKHKQDVVKNFPFNRLTSISYSPIVKVGDKVSKGKMIANSNFTDAKTGAYNLGKNLDVAVYPYKGLSFDDAYVISEKAAKKLTTQRMYEETQDTDNDNVIGKNKFVSLYPKLYNKDQLENIDHSGVVKHGTILHKGDPIILSTRPRTLSTSDIDLGRLHKVLSKQNIDTSVVWEHEAPGEVIDIARTRTGKVKVNINSVSPAREGDKLCFTPDMCVLTLKGWKYVSDITTKDVLFSLTESNDVVMLKPDKVNEYDICEDVIDISNKYVSLGITDNHKLVVFDIPTFSSLYFKVMSLINYWYFKVTTLNIFGIKKMVRSTSTK